MTNKNITLHVWNKNSEKISVVQGEVDSRFLNIKLMDQTAPLDLTDKAVTFLAKKPDNTVIFNNAEITDATSGMIQIQLTSQVCAVAGTLSNCEIHIIDNNSNTLIVKGIDVEVVASLGEAVEESISEYTAYEQLVGSLNTHEGSTSNPHNVTALQAGALPDSTKYGATLYADGTSLSLKDQDGTVLNAVSTPDTTYSAGTNVSISDSNVISATDTKYSTATTSADGLMSSTDKSKLDGLSNYTLPVATASSLGGIKVGSNLSISDEVLSAVDTTYSAGTNVSISDSNVISATDTTYSPATTSADGLMSSTDKSKLDGIVSNASVISIQSDWNVTDNTASDFVKNKPTIPTQLTDLTGTLPITQGGTGAATSSAALTNLGTVPVYTSATSFITYPCTISELVRAMPSPAILMIGIDVAANTITDLPCSYGILTIHKRVGARAQILYNRSYEGGINGSNLYFGNYNTYSRTVSWNKIFTNYSDCQVPIANGGTGARTATAALTALGGASGTDIGNVSTLSTTNKTVVGAINELYTMINNL